MLTSLLVLSLFAISGQAYVLQVDTANSTPALYAPGLPSLFNVTWQTNGSTLSVLFESNFSGSPVNYTMTNLTAAPDENATWNFSVILPAGSFYWKSYANDSNGEANQTPTFNFTIAKAPPGLNLSLNGSFGAVTITQGSSIWLNGSLTTGDVDGANLSLLIDGVVNATNTSGSISNLTLFSTPGIYNISINYTSTQNYSDRYLSYLVNVLDSLPPAWSGNADDTPSTFDTSFQLNFTINWTDAGAGNVTGVSIEVNRSGTVSTYQATNSTDGLAASSLWNLSLTNFPAGTHYWRSNATDDQGNENVSQWFSFTISRASPTLNLTINNSAADHTTAINSTVLVNGTILTGDSSGWIELYVNNTLFENGTTAGNTTSFAERGTYPVNLTYRQTQNYSESTSSYEITVQDVTAPTISSVSSSKTTSTATITWDTDKAGTSVVTISTGTTSSSSLVTSHSVELTGLASGVQYSATVKSCNADNFCSETTHTFTTVSSGGGSGNIAPPAPSKAKVFGVLKAGGTYLLSISDSDIAVSKVEIEVARDGPQAELKVVARSAKPSASSAEFHKSVYKYLDITAKGLDQNSLRSAKITFSVTKSWLAGQAISKERVSLYRLVDGEWQELETSLVSEDDTRVTFIASTPGFSTFAVAVGSEEQVTESADPEEPVESVEELVEPVTPPVQPTDDGDVFPLDGDEDQDDDEMDDEEDGLSALGVMLLIGILALGGFFGYRYWAKNQV